ncbi:hypothetical protein EON67_10015 [archaeon]|nr:MAG: hypothetical protein EON67_10015 [archaeon]
MFRHLSAPAPSPACPRLAADGMVDAIPTLALWFTRMGWRVGGASLARNERRKFGPPLTRQRAHLPHRVPCARTHTRARTHTA